MATVHIKRQIRREVRVVTFSMTSVLEEQIDIVDVEADPYQVLLKRIELVKEMLECDDEEAERVALNKG